VTAPVFEALEARVARGVKVRMLIDHMGSRSIPEYAEFEKRLTAVGIDWRPMLPVRPLKGQFQRPDLRNHRKLLVVDGKTAFMGSQNLIEPGYNKASNHKGGREYVELVARIDGPAGPRLARGLRQGLVHRDPRDPGRRHRRVTPAHHVDGVAAQILPSGPGYATENNLRLYTALIYSAQQRISVTSPYFVPDEPLLYA
jgi:cardiolipin synthase